MAELTGVIFPVVATSYVNQSAVGVEAKSSSISIEIACAPPVPSGNLTIISELDLI